MLSLRTLALCIDRREKLIEEMKRVIENTNDTKAKQRLEKLKTEQKKVLAILKRMQQNEIITKKEHNLIMRDDVLFRVSAVKNYSYVRKESVTIYIFFTWRPALIFEINPEKDTPNTVAQMLMKKIDLKSTKNDALLFGSNNLFAEEFCNLTFKQLEEKNIKISGISRLYLITYDEDEIDDKSTQAPEKLNMLKMI